MELTAKQEEGLKIAISRYKNREPYTCISGYAGSGKTTLIKFIIEAIGILPSKVAYIAYTGKAAEVLRKKGNPNAMTAHKLLYYTHKNKNGTYSYFKVPTSEIPFDIIIVDEVSMLPNEMWELLLSHKKYVIACGDPFQLPPPACKSNSNLNNHVLDNPHVFLDEIMRQAQDSEIIRLSMDIREGRPINYFRGNEVRVVTRKELENKSIYKWADQILVGTNNARQNINNTMRQMLNFGNEPAAGDKVISLTNHWDCLDFDGNSALVNGTIGYLGHCYTDKISYPVRTVLMPSYIDILRADFKNESGDSFGYLMMDYNALKNRNGLPTLNSEQEYAINKNGICKAKGLFPPYYFNYGYAITTHRAQGSQWDKVLVLEEDFPYEKEEHARWLYTAVTRSSKKLILVR